jgi:hypothetical protein
LTHTKTITRPDGSRVMIKVEGHIDVANVMHIGYQEDIPLDAEILQAKLELWEKLKPTL